jgi:hypothetical protein
MDNSSKARPIYENLNTAYVNLAALLRYLQQQAFVGRVRVEMEEYAADVQLNGSESPTISEKDYTTGREAEGQAALQRLLVRATEAGGLISVYEFDEASEHRDEIESGVANNYFESEETEVPEKKEEVSREQLLRASAELIGAVEHAALAVKADFNTRFRAARLELADDYPFLDPARADFEYRNAEVRLSAEPSLKVYTSGVVECLHRVVDKLAIGQRGNAVRERVALELAVIARRREAQLRALNLLQHLDRIAGTRVI